MFFVSHKLILYPVKTVKRVHIGTWPPISSLLIFKLSPCSIDLSLFWFGNQAYWWPKCVIVASIQIRILLARRVCASSVRGVLRSSVLHHQMATNLFRLSSNSVSWLVWTYNTLTLCLTSAWFVHCVWLDEQEPETVICVPWCSCFSCFLWRLKAPALLWKFGSPSSPNKKNEHHSS